MMRMCELCHTIREVFFVVAVAWFHVTLSTERISNITTCDICILITLWRGGTGGGASEKTEGREKLSPTARPSVQAGITAGPVCTAPNARDNGTRAHTHTEETKTHLNMNLCVLAHRTAHSVQLVAETSPTAVMVEEAARGRDSESKLCRVLPAVRPLKCHPDEAANQLEHIASDTPRRKHARLRRRQEMPAAISGALHNSCKSN